MPTDADSTRDQGLAGRVFLLRGASGALGEALCRRLCTAGAKVAVIAHRERSVASIRSTLRGCAHLVASVANGDGEATAGFVKGTIDSLGPIDCFVSTAGAFRHGPVQTTRQSDAADLMAANFFANHDVVRAVVGPMVRRKTGSIVLTGARVVGHAAPGIALYLASKSALHAYAACLAAELAPSGVAVTVVAPGTIDTPANRASTSTGDRLGWHAIEAVVDALIAASFRPPGEPLVVELG